MWPAHPLFEAASTSECDSRTDFPIRTDGIPRANCTDVEGTMNTKNFLGMIASLTLLVLGTGCTVGSDPEPTPTDEHEKDNARPPRVETNGEIKTTDYCGPDSTCCSTTSTSYACCTWSG